MTDIANSQFAKDVRAGLTREPKQLSSKYFYDDKGDKIFQQIMQLPEYYLTRAEYEVCNTQPVMHDLQMNTDAYDIIELGAGDGFKTKVLLRKALALGHDIRYLPIDISGSILEELQDALQQEIPQLTVTPQQGEYFGVLEDLAQHSDRPKLILFMGSNIGNLLHPIAIDFLQKLAATMQEDDRLFVGFDLKKDPATILAAYNDSQGVTASFNTNVLERINRELGGDFELSKWQHQPVYNPESGTCKSYLMATESQTVHLKHLDLTIDFEAYETIHTEISQKYSPSIIEWLCEESGLQPMRHYTDSKGYFANYILRRG
jgi:dimethylhistidine N-methyltransferase